ncbi:TetR/AcrR family transcriptional regulator [Haploplasma axanthum]|uniref:Intercellular adhesion protein R n=1 Tax=Haploplasma axanthum TaxID=29552 RepID=A0A449BFL8_HAPAX|nr:TetR/AcrR family transcriptional regulator [Haploplasma axanthum]VEU81242.1 Intercellular adhesion protein R [Haploplasma axanthum]
MQEQRFENMREEAKSKIKDAGLLLFSTKGFTQVSIQDIAKSANISTGLMYRYYKSKKDLFEELVFEATSSMDFLPQMIEYIKDPKIVVLELVSGMLNSMTESFKTARLLSLMSLAFLNDSIDNRDFIMEKFSNLYVQLSKVLEEGQKSGVFRSGNALAMATHLFTTIQGVANAQLVNENYVLPSVDMITAFIIK